MSLKLKLKPYIAMMAAPFSCHSTTQELSRHTECTAVHFFVNYIKSYGNYIVDADGNRSNAESFLESFA